MEFMEGMRKWVAICSKNMKCEGCPMDELCPRRHSDWRDRVEDIERIINEQFPTRLQYFMKSFPDAELNEFGIPTTICCRNIGLVSVCPYREQCSRLGHEEYCCRCWNEFWEDKKDGQLQF